MLNMILNPNEATEQINFRFFPTFFFPYIWTIVLIHLCILYNDTMRLYMPKLKNMMITIVVNVQK